LTHEDSVLQRIGLAGKKRLGKSSASYLSYRVPRQAALSP
jgi:hypothetical protein